MFHVYASGFFGLVMSVLMFVAVVQVVRKAGYSGWWALLVLVPVVNVLAFLWFAFAGWPVLRHLPDGRTGAPRGSVIAGIE